MKVSKIELQLGEMHFMGEGSEAWVNKQLDKVLLQLQPPAKAAAKNEVAKADNKSASAPEKKRRGRPPAKAKTVKTKSVKSATGKKRGRPRKSDSEPTATFNGEMSSEALRKFLDETSALENQNRKFLSVALYLKTQGQEKFGTRDITSAIKATGLPKLTNASMNLVQNIRREFVKKSGNQFMLTESGEAYLQETESVQPDEVAQPEQSAQ
ncbi:MAG: hypothetical protein IAF08_03515 [Rhizobacter sp.]|nr:hypothetical protein [Chlorobiales bacterium]